MAPRPSHRSSKSKGKGIAESSTVPAGILEVIPEPAARFDMSDTVNLHTNYVKCLNQITKAVSSDIKFNLFSEDGVMREVPVTEGLDHTPNGAFVIELTDGNAKLQLVCDRYQLWFRGIVTNGGQRYELDMKERLKAMIGSESLHSNGSYPHLLGDSVHICKIGFQSLLHAFRILTSYAGDTRKQKEAIAVILVMFFEAPRLQELYDLCSRLLKDKLDELVGGTNKDLINGWCKMCRDFYLENGGDKREVNLAGSTGSATKKVAKSVRILCRSPLDQWLERNNITAVKAGESSGRQ